MTTVAGYKKHGNPPGRCEVKYKPASGVIIGLLIFFAVLNLNQPAVSDSPAPNTIPIIAMKTGQGETSQDLTIEVLLRLLRHNLDGVWLEGWATGCRSAALALADSVRAVVVLAPSELQALNNDPVNRWARYSPMGIQSDSAFMRPDAGYHFIDSTLDASAMIANIEKRCTDLYNHTQGHDCIWYYDIFNEAPSWQLTHMLSDTLVFDDYFPNVFTQDTLMTEVAPTGVFSWVRWKSDSLYSEGGPTVSMCFGALHTIKNQQWVDYDGFFLGSPQTQANPCEPSVPEYGNRIIPVHRRRGVPQPESCRPVERPGGD